MVGEDDVVGTVSLAGVEVVGVARAAAGNCSLFHCGCTPLTSTLVGLPFDVAVLLCPPVDEDEEVVVVGVACNELLLTSMVGVLVISQVGLPSEIRA